MSVEQLDFAVLQKIYNCFTESQRHDSDHYSIYFELSSIVDENPDFFRYFIFILTTRNDSPLFQNLSIICLRRYLNYVKEDLIDYFKQMIYPVLIQILNGPLCHLTSHAAILLTVLYIRFKEEGVPDFQNILFQLISDERTIFIGLDSMMELISHDCPILIEHLRFLINVCSNHPESSLAYQFLVICTKLLLKTDSPEFMNFACSDVLQFIMMFYQKFQNSTLSEAMSIIAYFYAKTGQNMFGDFLIYCINTLDDLAIDGLYILSEMKDIPYYEPLVVALFNCLQCDEEKCCEFGIVSNAQYILTDLADNYPDLIVNVISSLIEQCQNHGQIFRALYIIADLIDKEQLNQYYQFAMEHSKDESRGDALLFLSKIEVPDVSPQILDNFIDLVLDQNPNVCDKAVFAINEILYNDSTRKDEWINPIFQAFMLSINSNDPAYASQLSNMIYSLLMPYEKLEGEPFQSFFRFVYPLFFSDDFTQATIVILDILLQKMHIQFSNEIALILPKIHDIMQSSDISLLSDSLCSLINTMITQYPELIRSFLEIIEEISLKCALSTTGQFWELINKFVSSLEYDTFSDQKEFLKFRDIWIERAIQDYTPDNLIPSDLNNIACIFIRLITALEPEHINHFLSSSIEILQNEIQSVESLPSVVEFIKKIIECKQQNGTLKDELVNYCNALLSQQI